MKARHTFVADDLAYADAYLVALARHHGAVVATFDRALAALHPHVTELVA